MEGMSRASWMGFKGETAGARPPFQRVTRWSRRGLPEVTKTFFFSKDRVEIIRNSSNSYQQNIKDANLCLPNLITNFMFSF